MGWEWAGNVRVWEWAGIMKSGNEATVMHVLIIAIASFPGSLHTSNKKLHGQSLGMSLKPAYSNVS